MDFFPPCEVNGIQTDIKLLTKEAHKAISLVWHLALYSLTIYCVLLKEHSAIITDIANLYDRKYIILKFIFQKIVLFKSLIQQTLKHMDTPLDFR